MDKTEDMARAYYERGLWKAAQVAALVAKGKLSKAAYRRITGKAYKGA